MCFAASCKVKSFELVPLLMVEASSNLLQGQDPFSEVAFLSGERGSASSLQELHTLRKVADKYLLPVESAKEGPASAFSLHFRSRVFDCHRRSWRNG